MTTFEVILLLCGVVCFVVSFIMGDSDKNKETGDVITSKLTEEQKSEIRRQINEIVEEEVQNASEKTEVSLDRISNTKILEMNEYAENILGQINRNHNETVFLYDMLNDKAKEVKTTVKDVNATKRQVEKIQAEVAAADAEISQRTDDSVNNAPDAKSSDKDFKMMTPELVKEVKASPVTPKMSDSQTTEAHAGSSAQTAGTKAEAQPAARKTRQTTKKSADEKQDTGASRNIAKERLRRVVAKDMEEVSKTAKQQDLSEEDRMDAAIMKASDTKEKAVKTRQTSRKTTKKTQAAKAEPPKEVADMNIQFEKGSNNNEMILKMYKDGKTNKEIAKELNLGVGEVKLVIDLYNSTK